MGKRNTKKTSWVNKWAPRASMGTAMFKRLPFFFFLSLLAMVEVWNVHRAQNTLREIEAASAELTELRWHASAVRSEIMYDNKQSEVLRRVKHRRLGLAGSAPRRLIVDQDQL